MLFEPVTSNKESWNFSKILIDTPVKKGGKSVIGGEKMSVKIIDDSSLWDSFVDESPHGVLFHKWEFLKIIEKYSGYTLLPFGIFEKKDKNLFCLFPLFYRKRLGMKMIFSQPPMSGIPFIGLLMNPHNSDIKQRQKESYMNTAVNEINSEIEALNPNYVSISLGPYVQDIRPFIWNGFDSSIDYTYVIDLNPSLDTIWNSFDKDCRREIRTTEKYKLLLKATDDVKKFYAINEDRYHQQQLKFPFFGSDYLKAIIAAFPNSIKLYYLYNEQDIINLVINYEYHKRMVFWKGWVSLDRSIHSNEFLTWEFIKQAKSQGLQTLEIQGADVKRLCLFKSKFNPGLEQSFTIHKQDFLGGLGERTYKILSKKRM